MPVSALSARASLVLLAALAFARPALAAAAADAAEPRAYDAWRDARQLVLVTTADWNAGTGTLEAFVRTPQGWKSELQPLPVTVGHAGAAWGRGLHPSQAAGPAKREGDGRSPAGVFRIGDAFGYDDTATTDMPYLAMRASHYCIDVAASPHYNRIVDADVVGRDAVAGSTEPMRRDLHLDGDQRYRFGFVIEHNPDRVPAAGSCIFAHGWKAPGAPTAGCTAMVAAAMTALLAWLQPEHRPVFVLLPEAEYLRLRAGWGLPGRVRAGR